MQRDRDEVSDRREYLVAVAFAVCCCAYMFILLRFGRPFQTDEIFFKTAGLHWSHGDGWRAPEESVGSWLVPGLDEVFFTYPPAYPFLFGIVAWLAGFGWRQCVAYDGIIHVALVTVICLYIRGFSPAARKWVWGLGIVLLFAGTAARPDELAMLFGYAALLSAAPNRVASPAGLVCFGLAAATSFPAAFALGGIYLGQVWLREETTRRKLIDSVSWFVVMTVVVVIACLPVVLTHPGAIHQNLSASQRALSGQFLPHLQNVWRYDRELLLTAAVFWLVSLTLLPVAVFQAKLQWWCRCWGVALAISIFFFAKYTFQGRYYWFFVPFWIAALLSSTRELRCSRGWALASAATVLVIAVAISLNNARYQVACAMLPQSERWDQQGSAVRSLIPGNARVLATDYWWILGLDYRVKDVLALTGRADGVKPTDYDYIVLTGRGSGAPGIHQALPSPLAAAVRMGEIRLIHDAVGRSAPSIYGIPLSKSSASAGAAVYQVAPAASPNGG